MHKLKGSFAIKGLIWLLFVIGSIGVAVYGYISMISLQNEWYGKSAEEIKREEFVAINKVYSIEEYNDWRFGNNENNDEYFKYGIIKAESLKDINLASEKSYLYCNFDEQFNINDLLIYHISEYDDGSCEGEGKGFYKEYKQIYEKETGKSDSDIENIEYYGKYADRICYDVTKGIVYYRADGNYYPVQNVSIKYTNGESPREYNYGYDFEKKAYKLNYSKMIDVDEETLNNASAENEIEKILQGKGTGSIVDLSSLNNTEFNYSNWGEICLDNIRNISADELTLIDSESLPQEYFIDEPGYYLDENLTLMVERKLGKESYWVLSLLPDSVPDMSESMYANKQRVIDYYVELGKEQPYTYLLICVVVMIVSAFCLIQKASYKIDEQGCVLGRWHKIPTDILSVLVLMIEAILLCFLFTLMDMGRLNDLVIFITINIVLCMSVVALSYLIQLSCRYKAKELYQNSICCKVLRSIKLFIDEIIKNIDITWKVLIMILFLFIIEVIIIFAANPRYIEVAIILLAVEKIVVFWITIKIVMQFRKLQNASKQLAEGDLKNQVDTSKMIWDLRLHGENLNSISNGMAYAVEEKLKSERFKTELITNVSHDIKTPLTSIVNYVDLLGKEELNNQKAIEYLEVLSRQSSKLKKLIEDLVEASKASTGNLSVSNQELELGVFITQTVGEFEEKLMINELELIINKPQKSIYICADGRHLWRVIDNLMNNICKYAQSKSRVYVSLDESDEEASITFRNISKYQLNISGDELMERFVRGDKARNSEGHGLGLSIAKSLIDLINGKMDIVVDGDLFKVVLRFRSLDINDTKVILDEEELEA